MIAFSATLLLAGLSFGAQPKSAVPKGYDAAFPTSYYSDDYRQSTLNDMLRRRECAYRVYRNAYDGSYIVVHKNPDRTFETVGWVRGDKDKGPALAFGSQRRAGDDEQTLTLVGALWILRLPGEELYTSVFNPYKPIGRRDLKTGSLVFEDRDRVADLVSWLERENPAKDALVGRFGRALAEALHADGGEFRRLEGALGASGWSWSVRTDKTRADRSGPALHLLGG